MDNSNKKKAKFLGMPYGTAANRLRKSLMFKFAQELGYDSCFACGEKIETPEDLSIEHKEPWLGRDVELFWDLDNIAFSHLKCNVPHNYGGYKLRKVGPEGTSWCNVHKAFLSIGNFTKNSHRWNGYQNRCIDCR